MDLRIRRHQLRVTVRVANQLSATPGPFRGSEANPEWYLLLHRDGLGGPSYLRDYAHLVTPPYHWPDENGFDLENRGIYSKLALLRH